MDPKPFLINPGCVAGSCVVVAGHKETLYGTSSLSRVTVCVRTMLRRAPSPQKRAFGPEGVLLSRRGEVARSGNRGTRFLMVCVRCRWHHSPLSKSLGEGQNDQRSRFFRMVGSRVVPLLARRLSGLNDVLGGPRGNAKVCESLSVGEI